MMVLDPIEYAMNRYERLLVDAVKAEDPTKYNYSAARREVIEMVVSLRDENKRIQKENDILRDMLEAKRLALTEECAKEVE